MNDPNHAVRWLNGAWRSVLVAALLLAALAPGATLAYADTPLLPSIPVGTNPTAMAINPVTNAV